MGSVVPDTTEAKCSGGGMSYSKLRISCRDTACRVRSQSTSNLFKIASKQAQWKTYFLIAERERLRVGD